MAKTLLFQFWVKPSGFLASKRYANVFVDDNGIVTTENVPGKEAINLPSVDDYKSTNYPYGQDSDISSFCNFTTYTRYNLKASRVTPWAYTTTVINDTTCGYVTPLPTPAVPSNPFGVAPYGEYAFLNYCDVEGVAKQVKIFKRHHALAPIEIEYGGASPIKRYYTAGDNKFATVRAQEAEFSFIATANFLLENIYTADEREYRLDLFDVATGNREFSGFIMPDNSEEPFKSPPYEVTIRATDGLGALKTITYPMPVGSSTDIRQRFIYVLAFALSQTNLNLDIVTMVNIYSAGMLNGLSDDPLNQASVNPLRMTSSNGDIYTCYDALDALCKQFGSSLSQVNGRWVFARINELAKGTARYRVYDYTALFKISGTLVTLRDLGKIGTDVVLKGDGISSIQPPYKLVRVLQEFGRAPDVIYNGDFEQWDGQNFRYWTRYGAINVSRIQKEITSSNGVKVLIDDYACRFNERANAGKWLEGAPVWMNKGQTAKMSMNIGKTDGLYDFKVRFNVGQFYLTNDKGVFEWVAQLATTTIRIDNRIGDILNFAISIEIPAIPVSGDMITQFYGFTKLASVNSGSPPPGGARPARGSENGLGGSVITYYEVDEYTPISIDNVAIQSTVDDSKRTKGIINVAAQNGFYTNKPDVINIIWGEYISGGFDPLAVTGSFDPTRPTRPGGDDSTAPQRQLQTIFNPDGSNADNWYEFGETAPPSKIGLTLARAMLRAYQTPYKKMQVSMMGVGLSYLDTFNIIVPNEPEFSAKIFMWQDAEFDDKLNEARGNLVEIFAKPIISNDYTTPSQGSTGGNGSDGLPPIIQNPNPPIRINGIFTEEFTPEFR